MFYSAQIREIDFYCQGEYHLAEKLEEEFEGRIIRFHCEIPDGLDEDDVTDILEEKLMNEIIRLANSSVAEIERLKYDHFEKG